MPARGTRGAYRKEDRVQLPAELQRELVDKAAARFGNCQELAKHLNIPKSSVHYYRIGRLTMSVSVLEQMLQIAGDGALRARIEDRGVTKDRSWATEYAQDVFREMCRDKLRLPTKEDLIRNHELRRKAAAIISYVMAEGSVWLQKEEFGEHAVNITLASHEEDLYQHFRSLCISVFNYDIGPSQLPGNHASAIRGFIYSRFVAEWLVNNGVPVGDKAAHSYRLPTWVMESIDPLTWISALQPWCDGEGSVGRRFGSDARTFSLTQSRHSDLDFFVLAHHLGWRGLSREIPAGNLDGVQVFQVPIRTYLRGAARSEVFDCVNELFLRIGFNPKMKITSIYLKDDGFWSCNWTIHFGCIDARKLSGMGLVTQRRKLEALNM